MSNDIHSGEMSVFIQLVSKAIENSAGLTAEVKNIAAMQQKQDHKLDGLLITMTEVKTLSGSMMERISSVEKDVMDHETRLRALEPLPATAGQSAKAVEGLQSTVKDQGEAISNIKNDLTRYVAIAGTVLVVVQLVIATFVAPWLQQLLFGS